MLALSRHSPEAASRDIDDVQSRTAHPVGVTLLVEFLKEPLLRCGGRARAGRGALLGMARPRAGPGRQHRRVAGRFESTKPRPRSTPDVTSSSRKVSKRVDTSAARSPSPSSSRCARRGRRAVVAAGGIGTRADVDPGPGARSRRGASRYSVRRCAESAAHPEYVDLLSAATAADTQCHRDVRRRLARRPARVLASSVEARSTARTRPGREP